MRPKSFARISSGRFVAISALLLVCAPWLEPGAQESGFSPARIGTPDGFAGLILARDDIPAGNTTVTVGCQGMVETDGRLTNYLCLPHKRVAFSNAVVATLKDQTFVPASISGEPVRVLMNFAVVFTCVAGRCTAAVIPNHGHHFDMYGLAYVAPQPVLPNDAWYDGFETKLRWARETSSGTSAGGRWENRQFGWRHSYDVSVAVNPNGTAGDGAVEWREPVVFSPHPLGAARRTVREEAMLRASALAANSITDVSYIPGFYANEPVEMRLVEYGFLSEQKEN
jgi:hypothetical protein